MHSLTMTGHAIRDVGLMTLTVFSGRASAADLTEDDLLQAANWLRDAYTTPGILRNHVMGTYLLNAGYSQKNPGIREPFVQRVLYGWQMPHELGTPCVFCGHEALYRATREEMPLLNGRGVINFSPQGRAGLPICGWCSLLIQMALLGCLKSGGGLLMLYTDHEPLLRQVVTDALRRAQQAQTLQAGDKWAALSLPRIRFVEQIIRWLRKTERPQATLTRVEGYYFSNSGASPFVEVFQIDRSVLQWVDHVLHYPDGDVAAAARQLLAEPADPEDKTGQPVYEGLLKLPNDAERFLRQHLMSYRARTAVHPTLITTFMEQIMRLSSEYIDLLKRLGDRFSQYYTMQRRFFYEFNRARDFAEFRRVVIRAADDYQRRTQQSLITMEEFIGAFVPTEDDDVNWRLSRDLITLYLMQTHAIALEDDPLIDNTVAMDDSDSIEEGDLS